VLLPTTTIVPRMALLSKFGAKENPYFDNAGRGHSYWFPQNIATQHSTESYRNGSVPTHLLQSDKIGVTADGQLKSIATRQLKANATTKTSSWTSGVSGVAFAKELFVTMSGTNRNIPHNVTLSSVVFSQPTAVRSLFSHKAQRSTKIGSIPLGIYPSDG
jgi:hypothetical protein